MDVAWIDHMSLLADKVFPNLQNFKREDPVPCRPDLWCYFMQLIRSFNSGKVQKSLEISWDNLNQGNALSKSISERISLYSQSIFYAPDCSPPLMVAYLKRSELLNQAGHASESKSDSEMAFQYFMNYANKSGNGIMFMNMQLEVNLLEKLVRETLMEINIPEEELLSYVGNEIMKILTTQLPFASADMASQNDEWNLPALRGGENVNFPSSSNVVELKYHRAKGRYVEAKCDIKMGDVLFVEEPFSHVVHKSYCTHCGKRKVAYFPCTYCRDVQYCSKACRDEDWISFHRWECGFVGLLKQTGVGYLSLKTFLKAGSNFDDIRRQNEKLIAKETFTNTVFSRVKYENVYNLLTNSENIDIADLLHYSLTSAFLSFYLLHYAHYAEDTDENIHFCAKIILRHIMQVVTNALAITTLDTRVDDDCEKFTEREEIIGSGIYPAMSMMNHSCEPSVFITYYKCKIIVKASKNIIKGDEVFNSYGLDCRKMCREDRKELLKSQYFFDCQCDPCRLVYDRFDVINSFKCKRCFGPLVKLSETERCLGSAHRFCIRCSHFQIVTRTFIYMDEYIKVLINRGDNFLKEDKNLEAFKTFWKAFTIARGFFYGIHGLILQSAQKIAVALLKNKQYIECMRVLSATIICLQERYGMYSSELAIEAKKLSDVIYYHYRDLCKTGLISARDVPRYSERAHVQMCKEVLEFLLGNDHPIVREVTNGFDEPEM